MLFTREIGRAEEKMDQEFNKVHDEIAELRTTVDRIDNRDKEDTQTLFREVEHIKRHIGMGAKPLEA